MNVLIYHFLINDYQVLRQVSVVNNEDEVRVMDKLMDIEDLELMDKNHLLIKRQMIRNE